MGPLRGDRGPPPQWDPGLHTAFGPLSFHPSCQVRVRWRGGVLGPLLQMVRNQLVLLGNHCQVCPCSSTCGLAERDSVGTTPLPCSALTGKTVRESPCTAGPLGSRPSVRLRGGPPRSPTPGRSGLPWSDLLHQQQPLSHGTRELNRLRARFFTCIVLSLTMTNHPTGRARGSPSLYR